MANSTRCAACKSLRRRCSKDCVLAPHFPANNPERFSCVHKIFGASNVTKNLETLPNHTRRDAANCIAFEANARIVDPVYGSTGIIFQLKQQIIQTQYELERIHGEITVHKAKEDMLRHQLQQEPSASLTPCNFEEPGTFYYDELHQFGKF